MAQEERFNLVVIGAGAAGLVSSLIAATVKARVALVERHLMGGDCLNYGCVPSKALIRSARLVHEMKHHRDYGIAKVSYEIDFREVMARVHQKISKIAPHDSVERYTQMGVECIGGDAHIVDPHTVRVGDRVLRTRNIILALGAEPQIPPLPGLAEIPYLTSENLWNLEELPRRLIILGGGPIGCELAQAFRRLGSDVTQIEMAERLLPRDDADASQLIANRFAAEGIRVLSRTKALEVKSREGTSTLVCEGPGGQRLELGFDKILVAVGRKPRTAQLEGSGLAFELNPNGTLKVDRYLRTSHRNIYACGDVIGPYQFTHTASHQAWFCAVNALFSPFKKFPVDYRVIPRCTFTDPEVAQVGHSELSAKEAGIDYEVATYGIDDLDRAITDNEDHGFVKVLTAKGKDRIIGCTIVGHLAGELLSEYVLAMKNNIGLNRILGTIHAYPTFAEANKYAAGVWRRAHAPQWALGILAKFHAFRR